MVYVDPKNLGYDPFWYRYVHSRQNKQERDDLNRLYDKYVNTLIDMVIEGIVDGRQGDKMKTIVPVTNLNLVQKDYHISQYTIIYIFVHITVCFLSYICYVKPST
jgi:dynein heavy chain